MRLHLDSSTAGLVDSTRISPAEAQPASSAQLGKRSAGSDSIGISGVSAALGKLSSDRASRIEQLSASVRSGTYSVPAAAISGTIVSQAFGAGLQE